MADDILLKVERPARYMGGEIGVRVKVGAELRFVLAFPDVYEVGMSHLGLKILYGILNGLPWLAAERAFTPWPDMEEALRAAGEPLATLETGTPLGRADIVGFTLQYELAATNILTMLDLAGIPLLASERDQRWPLVLGGGPGTANPEPLADFFDAFLLGDGEEAAVEIAVAVRQWRRSGAPKKDLQERLAAIEGVYVPALFAVDYAADGRIAAIHSRREGAGRVRRRFLADLDVAPYPTGQVVPFLKTIHDRVGLEVTRGCTRGCRFCQAGYLYRPVRERTPARILELIEATLRATGYDDVSLLSLSTGDYTCIAPLLQELMARYAEARIAVSLPSLRVGTLTEELVAEIRKVRKTGFTLAPEAGSERLREIINKRISEDDLLASAHAAYGAGWRLIKLYFMIGLPGETREDLLAIIDLAARVKGEARRAGRHGDVNVSVSSFVPKPHTPFQWEPQIGESEIRERQELLRQELKRRRLNFKWHDARLSVLEGVFARGDRRLGRVLLEAQRRGCRFDGWSEHFRAELWQEAFAAVGLSPEWYLRRRDPDEILPWDHLDFGVSREYLLQERQRAAGGEFTADCRDGDCTGCGVCDFREVRPRTVPLPERQVPVAPRLAEAADEAVSVARIRLRFAKTGPMRYLSHLEMITLFTRAVATAGIPVRFSAGFHPHPKFSFATALSVGIESVAEFMELEVAGSCTAAAVSEGLNRVLPAGLRVLKAAPVPPGTPSLTALMDKIRYRVTLPAGHGLDLPALAERFLACESSPLVREKKRKGRVQEFDLRQELAALQVSGDALEMLVGRGKPLEFAAAVTGLPAERLAGSRVEKIDVIFKDVSF